MNKTDFRNLLNLQRTYVVSLAALVDSMPDMEEEKREMFSDYLKHIWLMGEVLSQSVGVKLETVNDIIKIGEEILELEKIYALE